MSQNQSPEPSGRPTTIDRRQFVRAGFTGSAALLGGGVLLAACGSDSKSTSGTTGSGGGGGGKTIGFSHPFAEVPVVQVVKRLAKERGEQLGYTVLLDETRAANLQDQVNTLELWVNQRVDAICAFPTELSTLESIARRARDKGIVWTTYAEPMENSSGGVLFSARASGTVVGKAVVEWINANDPEAEVLILQDSTNQAQRPKNAIPEAMIKAQTRATIVAKQDALDQSKGLQVAESVLTAHPNLSVVVGQNDDGALGAAEAFRKAGKDVRSCYVIGQDGSKEALTAILEGSYMKATSALDIRAIGYGVAELCDRVLRAGGSPDAAQVNVNIIPELADLSDRARVQELLSALG